MMRSKYLSLLTLVLSILVIGATVWFEWSAGQKGGQDARKKPIIPLSEVSVPSKPVLDQIDYLERRMHLLAAPPRGLKFKADLSGLGYVPVTVADPSKAATLHSKDADDDYRLTLAFTGQVKRYCIIDDNLYAEGAELPDGAKILSIQSKRVLIDKASVQQWLEMVPLLDRQMPKES